jgi:predicted RNA binding protein YcfA (HicA-like mRNA interferase family)
MGKPKQTQGLPRLKGKELIKVLGRAGFEVIRVKGSHHRLKHHDGRITTVPVHAGDTIGSGLLGKILKDCELSEDELKKLL